MIVTIKDIAKALNISSATVSRALNGKPGVSDALRDQIVKVAREIGYHPNAIAQGLVKKTTHTIGLIIPDITNPFYPMIARGIEEASREDSYQLFLGNSNWEKEREKELIRTMISNRVDGIIIDPATTDLSHISGSGIPTVYLSSDTHNRETAYVGIDNHACGYLGVKHLYEKGYRRIAYIGGTVNSFSNQERIQGYLDGLTACNLEKEADLIRCSEFSTEWGYEAADSMLSADLRPDSFFAGNDLIAYGILNCLQQQHLSVPAEIGVLGIDNIPSSALPQISLSSIGVSEQNIGNKAFILLRRMMESSAVPAKKKLIEPIVVERSTTARMHVDEKS